MAQQFRATIALAEGPGSILLVDSLQSFITPVPGDPVPVSSTHIHVQAKQSYT